MSAADLSADEREELLDNAGYYFGLTTQLDDMRTRAEKAEAELERIRPLIGRHDPTGADHLDEAMAAVSRAEAAEQQLEPLLAVEEAAFTYVHQSNRTNWRENRHALAQAIDAYRRTPRRDTEGDPS